MFRHKLFTVGKDSVQCVPEWVRASHARLTLARRVELPPHTQVFVICKATQSIKHFEMACTVAQPANNIWRYAEDGLVISPSLMAADKVTHHIPVMNLLDATQTLHKGTRLGDVFPVDSLTQVQEMLWVDSDLSDWDSDDEELMDVRAAGMVGRNVSAKTPCVNAHDDTRMDPKDLQESLHGVDSRRYLDSRT